MDTERSFTPTEDRMILLADRWGEDHARTLIEQAAALSAVTGKSLIACVNAVEDIMIETMQRDEDVDRVEDYTAAPGDDSKPNRHQRRKQKQRGKR